MRNRGWPLAQLASALNAAGWTVNGTTIKFESPTGVFDSAVVWRTMQGGPNANPNDKSADAAKELVGFLLEQEWNGARPMLIPPNKPLSPPPTYHQNQHRHQA